MDFPIDSVTQKKLNKLAADGVISNWWIEDIELSKQIVRFRNFVKNS
ncbi:hypothetical protein HZA55_05395 [Candidatus Poribacteria bacterium]|nr:hypothetical protein [Candidatus Poribacteria bacterium]